MTNAKLVQGFDSTAGVTTAFNTTASANTTNKTEGAAALQLTMNSPTAEAADSKVGGMAFYTFDTPADFSSGTAFTLDFYVNGTVNGSAGLQVNFVTNGSDDGYNFMMGLDNITEGWHTMTMTKASPSVTANGANWSSIRAIRITYFNYDSLTTPTVIMVDNLKLVG